MYARALLLAGLLATALAGPADARSKGLRPFTSCKGLLSYVRTHGTHAVRTGWLPTPMFAGGTPNGGPVPATAGGATPPSAAPTEDSAAGSTAGAAFSTTNTQEDGVDEPDVVKSDGKLLYAVANGWLHAVDTSSGAPVLLDTLQLPGGYGYQLLLDGDRLLVLQTSWIETTVAAKRQAPSDGGSTTSPPPESSGSGSSGRGTSTSGVVYPDTYSRPVTRLTEVDVSDPSALRVIASERDDGEYVTARMVGQSVRVVLASRAPVMYAIAQTTAPTQARAIGRRVRAVRHARLSAWRPRSFYRRGTHKRTRSLVGCRSVSRPLRFSGLDTATVVTVDMTRGLPSTDARAIMSDAQIVYGSTGRLYVATQRWLPPSVTDNPEAPHDITTQIHEFDVSDTDTTSYVATGEVHGFLLNQFAMSEHHGVLRVASTDQPLWWGSPDAGAGSSVVTLDRGTMQRVGRVGGLGKGERIYAVRFIGDTAYVVTFRQVDPLFTVDLSDPADPKVVGQLELEGYSAYLHPLSGHLLLGVGRDIGSDNEPSGTRLSLFDVTDPAAPKLLTSHSLGGNSYSDAEYDHHAFLYWPATKLAVLPVSLYGQDSSFVGAIGLHVDRAGIEEVGRISHPADDQLQWPVQRVSVIGDQLYSLSDEGVLSSALSDLTAQSFTAFPDKPTYYGCGGPYKGAAVDGGVSAKPCYAPAR